MEAKRWRVRQLSPGINRCLGGGPIHQQAGPIKPAGLDEIENGVVNSSAEAEVIGMEQRWRSGLCPLSGAELRCAAPNKGIEHRRREYQYDGAQHRVHPWPKDQGQQGANTQIHRVLEH
jgi:hypothetical protein